MRKRSLLSRIFHGNSAAICESLMDTVSVLHCSSGGMRHTAVVAMHRLPCLHQAARHLATNHHEIFGLIIFFFTATLNAHSFPTSSEPEVRRAIPLSSPNIPQTPSSKAESSVRGSDIRIAPIAPADAQQLAATQLAVADGFFNRKDFSIAATEYEKFLRITPSGQVHREEAFFRLGECRRKLDNLLAAQEAYQQLLKETSFGIFAAGAAYRLGEYYQQQKEYQKAVSFFAQAVSLSDDLKIKTAARYQQALCSEALGSEEAAIKLFQEVAQEDNAHRTNAQMALAHYEEKAGHLEKAITLYDAIGKTTSGRVAAEAFVKAGTLAYRLEKKEPAKQYFTQATLLTDAEEWESIAALALMKIAYEEKEYQTVVTKSGQALAHANVERKIQALFLTAQAEQKCGNFKQALSLYDQVISEAPTSTSAHDATFTRLLVLHSLHDSSLLSQLNQFLQTTTDSSQQKQAQLLKAEVLFQLGNYPAAATAYGALKGTSLSPELKSDILYKEAWAWNQAGDSKKALELFSEWMIAFPQSPQFSAALIQHALLEQKRNDLPAALADYSKLITSNLKTSEREFALQQKALLHGQLQDNKQMVETFQQLLQEYPQTKAAAQANFWIGWASFESKDYAAAIPFLEKARLLDAKQFGERASLRLLLAHYYLEQISETLQEASSLSPSSVPLAVAQWMGLKAYELGKLNEATKWLTFVTKNENSEFITAEVELALAQSLLQQEHFREAVTPATKALELSKDPASRAAGTLVMAAIQHGLKNDAQAMSLVQEALLLQPEGKINMQARLLLGDLFFAQRDYDAAARAYRAIALLTQDKKVIAQALHQAAESYRRTNNLKEAEKVEEESKLLKN